MKAMLHDRLADLRLDMPADVADRHAGEIRSELNQPGPIAPERRVRRRWILPVVVAAALLIPAAALAAESSAPGDFLYPVKRTTEWMRSMLDSTVDANHRVDELEIVIRRGAPIEEVTDRLADAVSSVEQVDAPRRLVDRVDTARDQIAQRFGVQPGNVDTDDSDRSSQDRDIEPPESRDDPPSTTTEPPDEGFRDTSTSTTAESTRGRDDSGSRDS